MPYILKENREELGYITPRFPDNCGELNYWLTLSCLKYLASNGECYQIYNDIIGALESCKLEMYRRMIAPYEDKKIKENGDVYPEW